MTIIELEKEIDNLEKQIKELNNNNKFLLQQQKELTRYAEKAGSEMSVWKHNAIRLEEENKILKTQLETMRKMK